MSACKTGKVQFDSWERAMKVRGRYSHEGRCSVYRCEFCGKWHIGRPLHKTMGRPRVDNERIKA